MKSTTKTNKLPSPSLRIPYVCIVCKKPILEGERLFHLGIDKPRINLKIHFECWRPYNSVELIHKHDGHSTETGQAWEELVKENIDYIQELALTY